jgi:hypothetical protein
MSDLLIIRPFCDESTCQGIPIEFDDGSTEGTSGIIRYYAAAGSMIVHLNNEGNLGLPKSLNMGIELAEGKDITTQRKAGRRHKKR